MNKKEAKNALKCLGEVQELLSKGTWIQGAYHETLEDRGKKGNHIEAYCLVGAAKQADGPGEQLLLELLCELIMGAKEGSDYDEDDIINWNDSRDRKWKEVNALLRKAEKRLTKVIG